LDHCAQLLLYASPRNLDPQHGSKAYDPWGELIAESGVESSDLGFQSDPTDENTGLVDMGARHYLPELGRFLTNDPLRGNPMESFSGNRYIYGLNDPASMWDPTGLMPMYCEQSSCESEKDLNAYRNATKQTTDAYWSAQVAAEVQAIQFISKHGEVGPQLSYGQWAWSRQMRESFRPGATVPDYCRTFPTRGAVTRLFECVNGAFGGPPEDFVMEALTGM
jgi:RHS repeat-associated protein